MERGTAVAVGRLVPGGPWVGFAREGGRYALVFGDEAGVARCPSDGATPRDLLSVALLYFGDAADAGPESMAATHRDVGDLVRWLADSAADTDAEAARRLRLAVDAIDDGLAADAVMLRLEDAAAVMAGGTDGEQVDPLDLLAKRYRALVR